MPILSPIWATPGVLSIPGALSHVVVKTLDGIGIESPTVQGDRDCENVIAPVSNDGGGVPVAVAVGVTVGPPGVGVFVAVPVGHGVGTNGVGGRGGVALGRGVAVTHGV